jgi:restriction endonuclease S subunit
MNVPGNWTIRPLRELQSLFHNGVWGDDPSQNEKAYLVIRSTEIDSDGRIDPTTGAYRVIPESKVIKYALEQGDILLVGSSGSQELIGRAAFWDLPSNQPVLFSNFMICLRPKGVVPKYLFYSLKSYRYSNFLKRLQQTSTGLRNLPKDEFLKFQIPCPPVPEQKKIVEILSTVDERIENTNEKINKIKKIRKTAINKFFLNYNNEKKYKLGEIFSLEYGKGLSENMRKKGKYPVMGSNGIIDWHSEYLVKGPGIVVGRKGTIGAVVYTDSDFWPIDTAYYVEVKNKEKVNLKWLSYKLENLKLNKLNMATGVPGLNREIVYEQKISIPEISLQNIVVENISNIEKRIITEETKKEVLIKIKKSLMNDLLSGKKRVRIP